MAYVGLNPQTQLLNTSTETFSGNSVAYQFNLSRAVASASDLDVMIGTTLQRPNTDYEAENTVLMFQTPPATGTNNITVTYRAGALNSLNLTANAFGAGTVGTPSVYSVAANNTGIYWGNATTMIVTNGGSNHTFFNGNTVSTGVGTGALVVQGGASFDGNIHANGELHALANTVSTSVTSGALLVDGGAGIVGNLNVGQNITCVGDFTVNGTFTTTGTDSLDVTDPFIFLANANPGDTYDSGIVTEYDTGVTRYSGIFRDITDDKWKLFGNLTVKPSTTVDTSDASFQLETLLLSELSATGNVTGTYFLGNGACLTGIITSVSNVTNGTSGLYVPALNGNVIVNIGGATIGTVSSSVGLAITGNVNASTGISATGNIVGGNITTAGIASATGNITSAGNVSGGNILTGGLFSAAGNITGGNVNTGGRVSATGNLVTGANVVATGYVTAGGNVTGGNIKTNGIVSAVGDVYGDNFSATTAISAGTTVAATTDVTAGGDVSATGAVNAGTTISAVGNITGSYFLGNGRLLSGIDATSIQNGTSNVRVVGSGANVAVGIGGTSNVVVISSTGQFTTGLTSVTGNVIGGNLTTGGLVTATGNITGGNILTGGTITATGNIVGGNIVTSGSAGNIEGANVISATTLSATGNVIGGNIITTGISSAGGNVTGGNIITNGVVNAGGAISATGNVTGGNINTAGLISSTGNVTNGIANVLTGNAIVTSLVQAATLSATGNIIGGNLNATGLSLSGNVVSGLSMVTNITTTANITGGNILFGSGVITGTGNIVTTGNVVTDQVVVTGSVSNPSWTTTGIGFRSVASTYTDSSTLASGTAASNHIHVLAQPTIAGANASQTTTSAATLYIAAAPAAGTNMTITNPYALFVASGNVLALANIAGGNLLTGGLISAAGNITGGNINGGANVNATTHTGSTVNVTGNIDGGNLRTGGLISATGGITGAAITGTSLTVSTGTVTLGNIVNANANGVGNIGSSTTYFNTGFLKATTAQYADLAENYAADAGYAPGTVLVFGGNNEVTISTADADARVAGIVSTDPAHLMNSCLDAEYPVAVALAGRVPAQVVGKVTKGDMMVSAPNGRAQACATPAMGTVIGKALQDFDGEAGTIEIVVGRL